MNKGFTLIELLVVVLIIGILAAIALPQYTKAVERSRMSEAVQLLGDLATAQSINFMQQNAFMDIDEATGASQSVNVGDITMTLPGQTANWSFKADAEKKTASSTVDDGCVKLTATRKQGMYAGKTLLLKVAPSGAITKCTDQADTTGFKDLAATAGYTSAVTDCACAVGA